MTLNHNHGTYASGLNEGPAESNLSPVTKKPARGGLVSCVRNVALEIRRNVVFGAYHARLKRCDERIGADLHQAGSADALLAYQR
jgi:hypothetical protein